MINSGRPGSRRYGVIEKARAHVPVVFLTKSLSAKALDSYDKAYYVGTDSKESGVIQGDHRQTLAGEPVGI